LNRVSRVVWRAEVAFHFLIAAFDNKIFSFLSSLYQDRFLRKAFFFIVIFVCTIHKKNSVLNQD